MNLFIDSLTQKNTTTENGALSHSSSGSILLDQFSKVPTYVNVNRTQDTVEADMFSSSAISLMVACSSFMVFLREFYSNRLSWFKKAFVNLKDLEQLK